jgi:hypothetical protein
MQKKRRRGRLKRRNAKRGRSLLAKNQSIGMLKREISFGAANN